MANKDLHVVPRDGAWAVEVQGSSKPLTVHAAQEEAVAVGRKEARARACELIIHSADGMIRDSDGSGNKRAAVE